MICREPLTIIAGVGVLISAIALWMRADPEPVVVPIEQRECLAVIGENEYGPIQQWLPAKLCPDVEAI